MKHSRSFMRGLLPLLTAAAVILSIGGMANAQAVLEIDGRDVGNLASEGNHGTWHNPPVTFAFTFGGVAADNPTVGPGDPTTAGDTLFHFTGNDFGGLGFGISPDVSFDASTANALIDITVNPGNTLSSLVLNLKDRDFVPPIFSNIEEHQYTIPLGPAGTYQILIPLAAPGFTNNPTAGGSGPDFDPSLGLTEVQLQYPFGQGGSGAILDVSINRIAIGNVPEPMSIGLTGLGASLLGAFGLRRRRGRS